jgi:hypothetical protein
VANKLLSAIRIEDKSKPMLSFPAGTWNTDLVRTGLRGFSELMPEVPRKLFECSDPFLKVV